MAAKSPEKGTSQYKQIDGVRYERNLLEFADEAMKSGGTISIAEAKELWNLAMDGNKVTPTERRTLEYILKEKKFSAPAAKFLKGELEKTGDTSTPLEAVSKPDDEEKAEAKDEPMEAEEAPKAAEEAPKAAEKIEEGDAAEDKRAKVKADSVGFSMADATCNVMPSADGKLLMSLSSGGLQYLLSGVRCSAGVKSGRYFFETKIVEMMNPSEGGSNGSGPRQRNLVRIGVSSLSSPSPVLDESSGDRVYFDTEGFFSHGSKRTNTRQRFGKDQVMGVLLNLDAGSPNANTISLFRNGQRATDPQPLPEELVGKVLYPCITYKNVALEVNFGPTPKNPLPFTCRMLKDAAAADLQVASAAKERKNEVIFPVGLPEQGVFDWLDGFSSENPQYVELSDRSVLAWAKLSSLQRSRAHNNQPSNDKPGMNFNLPLMDDMSVQKTLAAVVPALKRDFIHMELKSNLVKAEREAALRSFPSSDFKKIAIVAMGEPSADIKSKAQEKALAAKVKKVQRERDAKKQEAERAARKAANEKLDAERREKREAERAAKKRAREEEKPKEEVDGEEKQKEEQTKEGEDEKKDGEEEKKEGEEKVEDEKPEEAQSEEKGADEKKETEEAKEDEKKEDEETKMEVEEEEVPVELTDEEKKTIWFCKYGHPDISRQVLAKNFASFCLPTKAEGFDEIRYVWQQEAKAAEHLKDWLLENKKTQRAEDLEPSDWFKKTLAEWTKVKEEWRKKQNDSKAAGKSNKPKEDRKENKEDPGDEDKKDKKEGDEEAKDEKMEEKKEEEVDEEAEEEEEDEPDVDAVEDINDIAGKPLYANFAYEDWVLAGLRFELHLLAHAFQRDLNDADRPGFPEVHLSFYYNKYYKKSFDMKFFNCKDLAEIVELVKDTLRINADTGFMESVLPFDAKMDKFVRLTEEGRRERQRCIDAGDETAHLKFQKSGPSGREGGGHPSRAGKGGDRGGHRGGDRAPLGGGHRGGEPRGDRGVNRGPTQSGLRGGYGGGCPPKGGGKGKGDMRGMDRRGMMPPPGYGAAPAGPRFGGGAPGPYGAGPYGAPPPGYGAPPPGYGAPPPGYGGCGYGGGRR